jgi:uncharacterized protein YndB with AHSA1/START domain
MCPSFLRCGPGRALAFVLLLAIAPACAWAGDPDDDIVVQVRREGSFLLVEVDCPVDAPRAIVWDVLTDYDHMARYLSNLEYSAVDERTETWLRVHQKGRASHGLFSLTFDNIREVELLPPNEIRSRFINGDFRSSTFTTRIVEVESAGPRLRILNSGRYTTTLWVPPIIGPALIADGIQKQFGEIRAEILRRHAESRRPGVGRDPAAGSRPSPG